MTMQKHIKNYFKAFGYDQSSVILCEVCGKVSVDIHHVKPRSIASKDERDEVTNLIALCRECHSKAHGPNVKEFNMKLKLIVNRR